MPARRVAIGVLLMTACARAPAPAAVVVAAPIASDGGAATSDARAPSEAGGGSEATRPDAGAGGCARGLLAAGSSWTIEQEGSSEVEGCYGSTEPWNARSAVRVRILDVKDGRPMHVAVEEEGSSIERPLVADFAHPRPDAPDCARVTRGIDGEDVGGGDPFDLLEVFAPPCAQDFAKPTRAAGPLAALGLRVRHALRLDASDVGSALTITPRGMAQRPFGRVRAFALRGTFENGGAGMCHSWTTKLRGTGMMYLAEREDVIVEASFEGSVTTDEGTCMGCGPGGALRCPPRRCARGTGRSVVRVICE